MALRYQDETVYFEDHCVVDEALELRDYFAGHDSARADLSRCSSVHTALVQILPLADLSELVAPTDPSLRKILLPFLVEAQVKVTEPSAEELPA